jgi:glycine/D-amino acid oxidase-like deaminating enzyme
MQNAADYDLVIIGGGILGAWSFYLATTRFPEWRTLLIERSTIGSGATAHSAGVWTAIGRTAIERSLALSSMTLYAEARARLNVEMVETNSYWVSSYNTFEPSRQSILDSAGTASLIVPDELASRFDFPVRVPHTEVIQVGGMPASCNPGGIARSLVNHGRRQPHAWCWEGVAVKGVHPSGNGAQIALANGTEVTASHTIVAVGPWLLDGLVGEVVTSSVRIKRVVSLHVDRRPPPNAPALFFPDHDAYLMPLQARQQWLFSFHRKVWGCHPDSVAHHVDAADEDEALSALVRYLPDLVASCHGGRAFCDAYATSGEPLVTTHPDSSQIVIAGAGAGKGFRLAPGIAEAALSCFTGP